MEKEKEKEKEILGRGNSINKGSGLGGAVSLEETEQFRFVEACDR